MIGEPVLYAAAAVLAGLLVGALLGALVRRLVARWARHHELEGLSDPAASLVFWMVLAAGIVVAVGVLAPRALETLSDRAVDFLPNLLVAVLMLIIGRAVATVAGTLLGAGLAKATGRTRRETVSVLRLLIMTIVVLLALGQLGVNTELLTLTFAAVLLTLAGAMVLLIGLGGRQLAREIAAGRYLRRVLREGDRVDTGSLSGTVVALHPVTTEMAGESEGVLHVPNTVLLAGPLNVTRPVAEG